MKIIIQIQFNRRIIAVVEKDLGVVYDWKVHVVASNVINASAMPGDLSLNFG